MRRLAEEMRDLQTRRMMLSIAQGYDKLAQRAQERAMGKVHKQIGLRYRLWGCAVFKPNRSGPGDSPRRGSSWNEATVERV
jgi:hypothetical protein